MTDSPSDKRPDDVLGWSDKHWLAFRAEQLGRIEPEKRDAAVAMLRRELSGIIPELRERIAQDPVHWIGVAHFGWGISVRNVLRQHGFGEEQLGVENLDDVYIPLVELAAKEEA